MCICKIAVHIYSSLLSYYFLLSIALGGIDLSIGFKNREMSFTLHFYGKVP